ncbi:hypothetical protein EH11_01715 [Bacillus subtilis]|nr:hypothetical protein EH11_01715 [Bacillus subtilis]RUS08591.1 hypothetical protein EFW59_01719 [Bacillus subtilis]
MTVKIIAFPSLDPFVIKMRTVASATKMAVPQAINHEMVCLKYPLDRFHAPQSECQ